MVRSVQNQPQHLQDCLTFCQAMAFGHLPSAIMLSLIPVPSTLGPAIAALVGRACFKSMDTAPRAAFTATIIPAHERTAVMGLINIVKTMS